MLFDFVDFDPRVWCDILSFDIDVECYFSNVYSCLLAKHECDLLWKILHGAIPTGRYLHGCSFADSPNCRFCNKMDDLEHIFFKCERLSALFRLTQKIIRKMLPTIDKIPYWWYIVGIPPKSVYSYHVRQLVNWIFALAKIAIVHSRFNKAKGEGTTDVCILFKSKIMSRLNVEYNFAIYHRNINDFKEKWNVNDALCIVTDAIGIDFSFS